MQEQETTQNHPLVNDGREAHAVKVDKSSLVEGEDNIFKCIHCQQDMHLAYNSETEAFSLYRQEDANDPNFGTVLVTYE